MGISDQRRKKVKRSQYVKLSPFYGLFLVDLAILKAVFNR